MKNEMEFIDVQEMEGWKAETGFESFKAAILLGGLFFIIGLIAIALH